MNFYDKKAQDGYLLDEYTFLGKRMSWQEFARLQERYIHGNSRTVDEVRSINLAKWIQEKQRAEQIIEDELDPVIREQMEEMYKEQCFALDNIFFGKEIHRPFI
jgi:hypothetical protein